MNGGRIFGFLTHFLPPSFSLLTNCCIFFVTQLLLAILHEKCISLRCFLHKSGSVKFKEQKRRKKKNRIAFWDHQTISGRGGPEYIYISASVHSYSPMFFYMHHSCFFTKLLSFKENTSSKCPIDIYFSFSQAPLIFV